MIRKTLRFFSKPITWVILTTPFGVFLAYWMGRFIIPDVWASDQRTVRFSMLAGRIAGFLFGVGVAINRAVAIAREVQRSKNGDYIPDANRKHPLDE